jgi:hypothetical protein
VGTRAAGAIHMRRTPHRLLLLALAAGAVISCDTRLPTASRRTAAPGTPPTVVVDSPVVNTQVNLGDSIFVLVTVTGGNSLKTLTVGADALTGDKNLGTFTETPRFATVSVTFPPGTTDTTVRRYLKVLNPGDQTLDSLVIVAIATDSLGLVDSSRVSATMVSGPHVTIESPAASDSIPPGVGVSISAHAIARDVEGIGRIQIHVTGDPTWPTPLDKTIFAVYDGSSRDVVFTGIVLIPLDATPGSRLIVNASSVDIVRQPGSAAPIALFIRSAASIAAPRVTQVVPTVSERTDTVVVTASGQGIVSVGLIVHDAGGNLVRNDTTLLPPPITSNVHVGIPLKLTLAQQGQTLAITAFAIDQTGRIGYAVRATTAGSETVLLNALGDSTQVVYGQTYTMPLGGTVGDVVADVTHGNVFLSNTSHNRLEVFQNATRTFSPSGVAVGSQPWGMTLSAFSTDTLLVANSGGTNFSRVYIGNGGPMREDLPNRIKTRGLYVFTVTESKDVSTGKITLSVTAPVQFSDRPQYIAQAATGRVYFSTQPTATAANGTIRWFDPSPKYPAPDPRLINSYATIDEGTAFTYVIFNVDSIRVNAAPAGSVLSDGLYIWDHPYGQLSGVICVNAPGCPQATTGGVPDPSVSAAISTLAAQNTCSFGPCPNPFFPSDIDFVLRLNVPSLGLTDTTFVASSVDRNWLAFGEGHTGGVGRVMLTNDPLIGGLIPPFPLFFSPQVTVKDLTDNASESVFGLALDKTGKTVASHGLQSYFSEVEAPFHLRLQGKYDSFTDGAGIALHPDADGSNTPAAQRLAFIGSSTGKVEIVDIAYFINRGTLALKSPIYGPLRVSAPMPGDDPSVILKLFALTARGLIVIDLTAADIKPGPP